MYGRERATALRERYPHAAEIMALYLALAQVWAEVRDRVPADDALAWAGAHVLPRVMRATVAAGPPPLAHVLSTAVPPDGTGLLAAWVADEDLTPVERYLAHATMRVVPPGTWHTPDDGVPGRCPVCGGAPQLSFREASDDPLVSGRRLLACAKCPHEWHFSATTCPNCGESGKRTVHAEPAAQRAHVGRTAPAAGAVFPHLRAESCQTCHRYLIDIDLGRDPKAVPRVDELAAVPIDLHMADQGYTKITPNLMGF